MPCSPRSGSRSPGSHEVMAGLIPPAAVPGRALSCLRAGPMFSIGRGGGSHWRGILRQQGKAQHEVAPMLVDAQASAWSLAHWLETTGPWGLMAYGVGTVQNALGCWQGSLASQGSVFSQLWMVYSLRGSH